jgi:hypothetical protein
MHQAISAPREFLQHLRANSLDLTISVLQSQQHLFMGIVSAAPQRRQAGAE